MKKRKIVRSRDLDRDFNNLGKNNDFESSDEQDNIDVVELRSEDADADAEAWF